jgi:hypothetical protein
MRFVLKHALVLLLLSGLMVLPSRGAEDVPPRPQFQSQTPRPYLGARLTDEIPDLLRKHLQLDPEQGLLVENIFRNGPADKAGLDKDDILISLQGTSLKSPQELFRTLREIGVGQSVTVELIHLGQRRQATIALEAMTADFRSDRSGWKYAIEPDESMVIRPGRMFQMRPGEKEWIEIPADQLKDPAAQRPTLSAQYHFLHDDGQKEYTVVIEGNPAEPTASITVKTPDKEYFTTAGQIEMLPGEYQQTVRNDVEKAKLSFENGRNLRIPSRMDFSRWQELFAEGNRPRGPESRGPESRGPESRGPDSRSADPRSAEQRLDTKLDALTRQLQGMEERQKTLEAYLKEKLK